MSEERNLRLDLFALALLAVVIFLALALCTYSPSDPPVELVFPLNKLYRADVLVHPVSGETANACGRWGALASDALFNALGVGALYLVFSLGVVTVLLLMRREINAPLLRLIGWLASLVGLTTLLTMFVPYLTPGPVIGAGGYLGALGSGYVQMHFATVGGFILASSLIVGGLLLCTDYVLIQLAMGLGITSYRAVRHRELPLPSRKRKPAASAAQDDEESDFDEKSVAIRIRGKRVDTFSDEEDEEEEEEELESEDDAELTSETGEEEVDDAEDYDESEEAPEDEESADEPAPAPTLARTGRRRRLLPSLRLRKPPDESAREEVMQQLDEASQTDDTPEYELPGTDLLLTSDHFCFTEQEKEVRRKAKLLEKTFASFGFDVKVVEIETGPVIAQYEVELEAGLRLSKITGLADDLAIALRVPSVRIVAPIPGKNTVGIEVPNNERQVVRLREVMEETNSRLKKMRIPLFLGKDVSGNPLIVDLSTLPHLLIAGRTGTGKSVCLNAIIASILMTRRPDEVRMLMIDPKMVELSGYKSLPHLMHPVVTDMRKAEAILAWAVEKMEERYELLARAGVRHVSVYNQLGEEELMDRLQPEDEDQRKTIPLHMPFIVIVADEIADLMMTAGKEVEQHIIRLAQKSRAVGIHLILATQKPTVDVITGLIKSNLPARIAFQVASRVDSRVVLDEMGADKLLGSGDMLFLWPGTSTLLRGQGTYLGDDEINRIVDFVSTGEQHFVKELVHLKVEEPGDTQLGQLKRRDDLYEGAVDIVIREGRGSVSLLQRSLGIGYGRAARLIDFMAEDGIVGAYAGSQAREVLITMDDWARMQGAEEEEPSPSEPMRPNKIVPNTSASDDQPHKNKVRATKTNAEPTVRRKGRTALVSMVQDADADDEYDEDADEDELYDEQGDDDDFESASGESGDDDVADEDAEEESDEDSEYEVDEYDEEEYEEEEEDSDEQGELEDDQDDEETEEEYEEDEFDEEEYEDEPAESERWEAERA